jgi:hypothetical protein
VNAIIANLHVPLACCYVLFVIFLFVLTVAGPKTFRPSPWVLCCVSIAALIASRWPVVMINRPLNPDEGQMIAGAMKLALDPVSWRSVDTTSSGPLNSMVLMWPYLFGKPVTFASARLTGLALIVAAWFFIYKSLSHVTPAARLAAAGGMMVFLVSTNNIDYVHYSSELLSIFLLGAAVYVLVYFVWEKPEWPLAFASGVALGAVPFAKLQGAPIAFGIGLVEMMIVLVRSPAKRTAISNLLFLSIGAVVPAAAILVPLALAGELHEFWTSYIGWTLDQIAGRDHYAPFSGIYQADPHLAPYSAGCLSLCLLGLIVNVKAILRSRSTLWSGGISLTFLLLSYYIIIQAGVFSGHYLLFLIAPLALSAGITWPPAPEATAWFRIVRTPAAVLFLAAVCFSELSDWPFYVAPNQFSNGLFDRDDLFGWLPKDQGGLLVWGWQPEFHVYSGLPPATRDVHSFNQIQPGANRDYFRRRLIRDFLASPPSIVIDGVSPDGFFYATPAQQGLTTFPELASEVAAKYTRISAKGDACPRTYVRNDILSRIKFAKIRSISASSFFELGDDRYLPELVDDFNVFENCTDRWLLANNQTGQIVLRFDGRKSVTRIDILNTRSGIVGDRASIGATLTLMAGDQVVFTQPVTLRSYPTWTLVPVPKIPSDQLKIDITSFKGNGGGLNEVKVEVED